MNRVSGDACPSLRVDAAEQFLAVTLPRPVVVVSETRKAAQRLLQATGQRGSGALGVALPVESTGVHGVRCPSGPRNAESRA